ncbi:hypothetical protein Leryth_007636 [Lithospermum erythrorhizon]|nr:hypothetical protein Leryth_007636 [Lithospermum erythrorhizon]
MGRWYEIASFPSRFQPKDGVNTRATYTLNQENGCVHVLGALEWKRYIEVILKLTQKVMRVNLK